MEEKNRFPFTEIYDHISGSENHILSFFLKHYQPVERLDDIQGRSLYDEVNTLMEDYEKSEHVESGAKTHFVASGSGAEGLTVPLFLDRSTNKAIWNSDFDMLRVFSEVVVAEPLNIVTNTKGKKDVIGFIVPADHPGFVKVLEVSGDYQEKPKYIPSSEWEVLVIVREKAKQTVDEDFDIYDHGPALTTTSEKLSIEIDNVYAYQCLSWPKAARNWLVRHRASNWISQELLKEVANEGFHIVAVGHPTSPERNIEWRISFSYAEKKLAHTLNKFQKKAYIIFKILHRYHFSFPKIIATYHLKTILFWVSDKLPKKLWSDSNMASCVYALVDQLIEFLSCKNIPNYFIPSNNMIAHIHDDFIDTVLKQVISVRKNILEALLNFDGKYRLKFGPLKPWKVSLYLLSDPRMKVASRAEQIYVFSLILADLANVYTTKSGNFKGPIREALYCLEESFTYQAMVATFEKRAQESSLINHLLHHTSAMFSSMSFQPHLNSIISLSNLIEHIVQKYNDKFEADDREMFSSLCGIGGIIFHCKSRWDSKYNIVQFTHIQELTSLERDEATSKAEHFFNIATSLDNWHLIDQAKLYYQIGKLEEAKEVLEKIVTSGDYNDFQITKLELPTLEKNLRSLVQPHFERKRDPLILPGIVTSMYYLCSTYLDLKDMIKANETLELLSVFCQDITLTNEIICKKMYESLLQRIQQHN